jgi:hypothetical protein
MRVRGARRFGQRVVLLAAVTVALVGASPAHGATEVGQLPPGEADGDCAGPVNIVQTAVAAGTSYEIPSGGGVITGWQHKGGEVGAPPSARLQVWRRVEGTTYTLVGRSSLESFTPGVVHTFPAQIPVSGGDLLGMHVPGNYIGCSFTGIPGDLTFFEADSESDPEPGEMLDISDTNFFDLRLNAVALLEPDCDSDGAGDESQDPSTAPCHPRSITLDANKNKVKRGKKVRLSGQIAENRQTGACLATQAVELQRSKVGKGAFKTIESLQTDAAGAFAAKEKVKKTFEYQAVLTETPTCGGQVSGTVKVKVKKKGR